MIHLVFHCGICGELADSKQGLTADSWVVSCSTCESWFVMEPAASPSKSDIPLPPSNVEGQ
jgi:hypothetical protein